jgi:conjugative transfer signal peptidase TraF
MTGRFRRVSVAAMTIGFVSVDIAFTARAAGLLFNVSRSAPRGIYHSIPKPTFWTHKGNTAEETYVFFCPGQQWPGFRDNPNYRKGWTGNCPDGYQALIKPVAAWPGDTVTVTPLGVAVNGAFIHNSMALPKDRNGKELHHHAFGNYKVGEGQIWVVSSYSPKSFDSRYFGPIPISAVQAWAKPLFTERAPR